MGNGLGLLYEKFLKKFEEEKRDYPRVASSFRITTKEAKKVSKELKKMNLKTTALLLFLVATFVAAPPALCPGTAGNTTNYFTTNYFNSTYWWLDAGWLRNNATTAPSGVMIGGDLLVDGGVALTAGNNVSAEWFCLNADCRNAWPAGGGGGSETHNGTFNETEQYYVYNNTPYRVDFNETRLNATIDSRLPAPTPETDPWWTANESIIWVWLIDLGADNTTHFENASQQYELLLGLMNNDSIMNYSIYALNQSNASIHANLSTIWLWVYALGTDNTTHFENASLQAWNLEWLNTTMTGNHSLFENNLSSVWTWLLALANDNTTHFQNASLQQDAINELSANASSVNASLWVNASLQSWNLAWLNTTLHANWTTLSWNVLHLNETLLANWTATTWNIAQLNASLAGNATLITELSANQSNINATLWANASIQSGQIATLNALTLSEFILNNPVAGLPNSHILTELTSGVMPAAAANATLHLGWYNKYWLDVFALNAYFETINTKNLTVQTNLSVVNANVSGDLCLGDSPDLPCINSFDLFLQSESDPEWWAWLAADDFAFDNASIGNLSVDNFTLSNPRGASAWLSGNQSLPQNTWTQINLNATIYNNRGEHSTTTWNFTAQTAGRYHVCGSAFMDAGPSVSSAYANLTIRKNGAAAAWVVERIASDVQAFPKLMFPHVCKTLQLAVGDTVGLWAYQTGTIMGMTVVGSSDATWMTIDHLG